MEVAERSYFALCAMLGRLLRAARYTKTRIVIENGERRVYKYRRPYAPIFVWLSRPLMRILDTGVRVFAQGEWEERERLLYRSLRRTSVVIGANGAVVLPCLAGETLAAMLENQALDESVRVGAVQRAVVALADLHARGFTHGDAMADNVIVDLDAGVAHWVDFETAHELGRPFDWRRADDLRALLATCLVRTRPGRLAETLEVILDAYADEAIARALIARFSSALQRPLSFHLGQAPLSFEVFRETARLLLGASATRPQ
jgi:hypothetical protein